ncbi:MAG: hypothetical protein AAF065_00745 [Verrucomicrobiota bacterium]
MSKRDRIMLMALPTAILFFIHIFFLAKPRFESIDELSRQAGVLEGRLPENAKLFAVRRELSTLKSELAVLQEAQSSGEAPTGGNSPEVSLKIEAFFETLLQKHGIIVISETPAAAGDVRSFNKILKRSRGGKLWEVELAADYSSVTAFLDELGGTELPLAPIAVNMTARYEIKTDLRLWNLWIYR